MGRLNKELLDKNYNLVIKQKPIRKIAFRGGGAKGIVYGGAVEALENKGILENVDTVAGSSAGSLTALLVALGMTAAEIKEQIDKTDFNEFKDPSLSELFSKRGLCKGDVLTDHIQKTIDTFLPKKIEEAKAKLLEGLAIKLKSIVEDQEFQSEEVKNVRRTWRRT